MAQKKSNKPKSAKPTARPASKPSKPTSKPKPNQSSKPKPAPKPAQPGGFTPISQTIKTTYQNSNGVRRTVIQTTSAPGKKSTKKQGAKK